MKGIKYQRYPSIVKENGNIPTKEKIRKIEQAVLDYKKALIKVGFYDSLQKLDEDQESDRAYYQAFINYFNQITI